SRKTAIITNTIDEADRITEALQSMFRFHQISTIHTRMPKAMSRQRFENFRRGKHEQILVAVHMLDEAADIPDLDLLIDLNRTISVIESIQRIGRLTRLSEGKHYVNVFSFLEITEQNSRMLLRLLDRLKQHLGESRRG